MDTTRYGTYALMTAVVGLGSWVMHDALDGTPAPALAASRSPSGDPPPIALTLPAAEPAPINVTIVPASQYQDQPKKQSASGPGSTQSGFSSYNASPGGVSTAPASAPATSRSCATAGLGGE